MAGVRSALLGTLYLIVCVAVFIVPVGVGTAVYLEEYADRDRWWNRLIEINIANLAGVPSIVYGILGLAVFVRGPLDLGRTILAGALTLSLLVLPIVIIASQEALRAVPPSTARSVAGARCDALADDLAVRSCPRRCPASLTGVDPRAVARHRRDGAADHARRAHVYVAVRPERRSTVRSP